MSDQPENLVRYRLGLIQRQNNRVIEILDRLTDDVRGLKVRATGVEEALAGVNRRLDRQEERLDRIERRLELSDAATH